MSATARDLRAGVGLAPAFAAARARIGLVALLLAIAAVCWWWAADRMQGMDNGPWSSLGTIGWFIGVWIVMMAAMMLPSAAPTVTLYARMTEGRSRLAAPMFVAGYLIAWAGAGLVAIAIALAGRGVGGDVFAWNRAGRWAAGATLLLAAGYELTPLKEACLGKCRSPLGFLLGCRREGWPGGLQMGIRHGGWCIGCCWALMASLFALGIMSLAWMALVAALITVQKTLPWRRVATYGVVAILVALATLVLADPGALPGLTIPHQTAMPGMGRMGS